MISCCVETSEDPREAPWDGNRIKYNFNSEILTHLLLFIGFRNISASLFIRQVRPTLSKALENNSSSFYF